MRYNEVMYKVDHIVEGYTAKGFTMKDVYYLMKDIKADLKDIIDLSGWKFSHYPDMTHAWVKSRDDVALFHFIQSKSGKSVRIETITEGWAKVLPVDKGMVRITAKEHTVKILREMLTLVIKEDWEKFDSLTATSHAGDGYGDENTYIDFTPHGDPIHWHDKLDIGDMVNMIRSGDVFEEMEEEK